MSKFFDTYPDATYASLCAVVEWARQQPFRFASPANLIRGGLRRAYAAGLLPELDPRNQPSKVERLLSEALSFERDVYWRDFLSGASTEVTKLAAYQTWRDFRLVNV